MENYYSKPKARSTTLHKGGTALTNIILNEGSRHTSTHYLTLSRSTKTGAANPCCYKSGRQLSFTEAATRKGHGLGCWLHRGVQFVKMHQDAHLWCTISTSLYVD